jgi:gamma-glutamylcyclotransferase (GGCT)/AIG2-like uncharacterized protein YtfP
MKIFVYGTLRSGDSRHRALQGSTFVCPGFTKGVLYNLGSFPAAVFDQNVDEDRQIFGEIYEVNDSYILGQLDAIEGVSSSFYKRKTINVEGIDGEVHSCLSYEGGTCLNGNKSEIVSGDWFHK